MEEQQTKQIIKYGICAANKDPHSAGRIRVIFDKDLSEIYRKNSNPEAILREIDNANFQKYAQNSYEPWFMGDNIKRTDPYVIEPFFPKHFQLIPKIGESIKVIFYNINSTNSPKEYVGPHISTKSELQYEDIDSGRSFTHISNIQKPTIDLTSNKFLPTEEDLALVGRFNSDLVLPNNSIYLRAGHKNYNDFTINDNSTLLQLASFQNKSNFNKTEVQNTFTPSKPINHIVEYDFNEDNKINGIIKIFKVQGVNNNNYDLSQSYNAVDLIFEIDIETNSFEKLSNFINNLLNNLDNRRIELNKNEVIGNDNYLKYTFVDNRIIDNGNTFFDPIFYAFRPNPENTNSVNNRIKNEIGNQLRPINKIPQEQIETEEVIEFNTVEGTENVTINASDKTFLLSWEETPNLRDSIEGYGIPQRNLLKLQNNTQPVVKGDEFLDLMLKIINIIETHGHRYDGPNTITDNVKEDIRRIKNELNKNVNNDLSGGPDILNQYIRIS